MRTLGNVLWHFPFGGFLVASVTGVVGLLFVSTVIAAPVGLGILEIAKYLLGPFTQAMVPETELAVERSSKTKAYFAIATALYLPFGIFIASCVLLQAFFGAISLFGIPVAVVSWRSVPSILNPVGKRCVRRAIAEGLQARRDQQELDRIESAL